MQHYSITPFQCPSPSPQPYHPPTTTTTTTTTTPPSHIMTYHTAFYWGVAHQILFQGWPGSSVGMYVLSVFFIFFLAIIVEWLSHCRFVKPGSNRVAACFFRTGMHAVRAGLAYMVMLSVMSYNGGIFIAAVVGHAVGYLIFGSGLLLKTNNGGSFVNDVDVGPPKF